MRMGFDEIRGLLAPVKKARKTKMFPCRHIIRTKPHHSGERGEEADVRGKIEDSCG